MMNDEYPFPFSLWNGKIKRTSLNKRSPPSSIGTFCPQKTCKFSLDWGWCSEQNIQFCSVHRVLHNLLSISIMYDSDLIQTINLIWSSDVWIKFESCIVVMDSRYSVRHRFRSWKFEYFHFKDSSLLKGINSSMYVCDVMREYAYVCKELTLWILMFEFLKEENEWKESS